MRILKRMWQQYRQLRLDWRQLEYLSVDLESNGMSPERDHILSLGWVPLTADGLPLGQSAYHVLESEQGLNQSAVIHGLQQKAVANGESLEKVIRQFAKALEGRVLVAHNARFDWRFLRLAASRLGIELKPLAVLDTLGLERSRLMRQGEGLLALAPGTLALAHCRERYALPAMDAHHALSDAIACAELFLAQAWKISAGQPTSAASLVHRAGCRFLA
ncbi:DNA polymerase-3 subunit epsilon [Natronospira proteinivora]|uniref:DNA polymerase-3 subunit epsilon n=1 Tax=Natronospira proteinivora TaxID=1807133 RepID=A0ABT1GAR3_9GAMM|nr:3'-5' exonuclease [Natronospira proteinivora]MCP1728421.1 DNA polymerase-3 subunit epsilon [Natronospira proteinivora]